MKPIFNWRTLGGLIGGLLVVCTFAAVAVTDGAAAAPANLPLVSSVFTPTPDIAGIAIRVVDPPDHAWVQVQWSNWQKADWYPVDSWSGPLSQNDNGWGAVWYTREAYSTGPFRYVIFDGNPAEGGRVWGMSLPFNLGRVASFRIVEVSKGENLASLGPAVTPDPRMYFYSPRGVEYKSNPAGCGHYTIAGDVLSLSSRPLSDYRVRVTYPSGAKEIVNAGGAPDYGKSGFGFLLAKVRPGLSYKLELLSMANDMRVASPVQIVFSGDCSTNEAWVVFQSER